MLTASACTATAIACTAVYHSGISCITYSYMTLIMSLASSNKVSSKTLTFAFLARKRGSGYLSICSGRVHSSLVTARGCSRQRSTAGEQYAAPDYAARCVGHTQARRRAVRTLTNWETSRRL